MNNQEILRKIVNYIENVMKEKSLTSRDLADICVKKTGKMSPRTIDNMFKTPSSTTLSTLLKVCDGLDLSVLSSSSVLTNSSSYNFSPGLNPKYVK